MNEFVSELKGVTRGLSKNALQYLRDHVESRIFSDGEVLVSQGAPSTAFHVLVSGRVDVELRDASGNVLKLASLEPGEFFGEMSLITGEPVSATILCRGETQVLVCGRDSFDQALAECPPLRHDLLISLAGRIREGNTKMWDMFERLRVHVALFRLDASTVPPIESTAPRMRKVIDHLQVLADSNEPVLIIGPEGAGKFHIAQTLQLLGRGEDTPFIVLDCRELSSEHAMDLLFGGRKIADAGSHEARLGLMRLAANGSLVLRHIESLDPTSQGMLGSVLARRQTREAHESRSQQRSRIIVTSCHNLSDLADNGQFDRQLAEQFAVNTVNVPGLADRRRDILPLARTFLDALRLESPQRVGKLLRGAERELLKASWRHRNVSELRDVVRFAALLANGDEIGSEHIFASPASGAMATELDVTPGMAERLKVWRLTRLARGIMLFMFGLLAASCLWGRPLPAEAANAAMWGLWWPLLLLSFVLAGRVWCLVCPLSSGAQFIKRRFSLDLPIPDWMKRLSSFLAPLLFLFIILSEHLYEMPKRPFATGVFLLSLIGTAILIGMVFQREAWCRYLCPVGYLAAGYSCGAPLQVFADKAVCGSKCETHDCFKGAFTKKGCPVFHHPLYVKDAPFCKLCLECLYVCPHGAARLYIGAPLQRLWTRSEMGGGLRLLSFFIWVVSLLMLGAVYVPFLARPGVFTMGVVFSLGAGAFLDWGMGLLFRGEMLVDSSHLSRLAAVFLLSGWGVLLAYHLSHLPLLAGGIFSLPLPAWSGGGIWTGSLLTLAQLGAISVGLVIGIFILFRIKQPGATVRDSGGGWGFRVTAICMLLHAGLAIGLIYIG
ncbi:MAG: sigma 54-interacting transcriptional regulator [Acidobacteriota bacterium]